MLRNRDRHAPESVIGMGRNTHAAEEEILTENAGAKTLAKGLKLVGCCIETRDRISPFTCPIFRIRRSKTASLW